jgi:hypothetical protein
MSNAQMTAISNPANGLLVYNTTFHSLYWYNGSDWNKFYSNTPTETDPVFSGHPSSGITALNLSRWDSTFSWGNHADEGYLTTVTETDPVFLTYPAAYVTMDDLSHWNAAYDNRITGATGTLPLTLNLNENQLTGSIRQAGPITSGYLTSTNWNTFNNKQNALIFGNITSSDLIISGGSGAVVGSGLNLTVNKGTLSSTDINITGGSGAILGTSTKLTINKGAFTENVSSVLIISDGAGAVLGPGTTIQVKQASATQSGYISFNDWTYFNNKQNPVTFGNMTSSDLTVTGGTGAVFGSGVVLSIPKGNLTSPDINISGGTGAVYGSGTTIGLIKGNLSETGSSVLTITNGTGVVPGNGTTIQVKAAGSSQSGYLSSADWNSFNNKVSSPWISNGSKVYYSTGNVGVGTSNPASTAILDLSNSGAGFLPPRMTMAQRDAIQSPSVGLLIYCTDCAEPFNTQVFTGATWNPIAYNRYPVANSVTQTGSPYLQATLTGSYSYFDADNDPEGSSTYQWYRADNASGLNEAAISGATNLTYTLANADTLKFIRFSVIPLAYTGASPGQKVYSPGYIGPISSFACGNFYIFITHLTSGGVAPVNKSATYPSTSNIPGEINKCWITRNLGASQQATTASDNTEASAGWYWQFNRKQGYKHDGTTLTPAWTITSISENSDWVVANDPCSIELKNPWRIPTYSEWYNVDNIGGWTTWEGPWGTTLKLHAAGMLNSSGSLLYRGSSGYYWSSSQISSTNGRDIIFGSGNCNMSNGSKALGMPVRCIREQ